MKHYNFGCILSVLLLMFSVSCSEESNLDPEGQWELTTAQNIEPASSSAVNDLAAGETINFSWGEASSSAGYHVYYSVVIDTVGSDGNDFDTPILDVISENGGKALSAQISETDIDEALSLAGYSAGSTVQLTWAVKSNCLGKTSYATANLAVKRFATEIIPAQLFISGDATETGSDLSKALPLKRLNNANAQPSNKFEIYTRLIAGKSYQFYSAQSLPAHRYGGSSGALVKSGAAIASPSETAVYRVSVDLDTNTYSLVKISQFGAIGSPFKSGWGGDEALEYQGGGVWRASINFVSTGGFIFRANGDWVNIMKRIVGTTNKVVAESDAASQGVSYEDIPSDKVGTFILTLDLSAAAYTYSIVRDPNASQPITAPDKLFLLANGEVVKELVKDGDRFSSDIYLALQANVTYKLNSKADGTGISYALASKVGAAENLGSDFMSGAVNLAEESGDVLADYDQAYKLTVDFAAAKVFWAYYNMKLFHWDNWDLRDELVMTYSHPYKFEVTANLTSNYQLKFNSPWAVEFGAGTGADANALSGTATNKAKAADGVAENFTCIKSDGSYKATIVVSSDYATADYSFVKQ